MPSNGSVSDAPITQFINCRILKEHTLQREDLWVRDGRILDPEKLFFDEQGYADRQLDCGGAIMAPGFIDVQLNGGYGVDFSTPSEDPGAGVAFVAKKILEHGVTSFCPTLVTSPPSVYHKRLTPHSQQLTKDGHLSSLWTRVQLTGAMQAGPMQRKSSAALRRLQGYQP
ncbi:unnamed protein product [Gadus morhua 'NCC']